MNGKVQRKVVVYPNDMEHNAVSLSISALVKLVQQGLILLFLHFMRWLGNLIMKIKRGELIYG
jgi:hypothetical protein